MRKSKKLSVVHGCTMALATGLQCMPFLAHCAPVNLTLASGPLEPGAIGLFEFSLDQDMAAGDSLRIDTDGSHFDTEIALYDAQGRLLATNDDMAPHNHLSEIRFDANHLLSAGNYTVALSGFNSLFYDGNIVPGSSRGGDFQLNIQTNQPVGTPSTPSRQTMDGWLLPASIREIELAHGRLEARSVVRFDFALEQDFLEGDWLAIHTSGSDFDTEIGLYDARGKLVAANDDIRAGNALSRLSFGLDGDNGRSLLAGAYTLLLGGFNTLFGEGLVALSSATRPGEFRVWLQSSGADPNPAASAQGSARTVPEPSSLWLTCLGLSVLLRTSVKPGLKAAYARLLRLPKVSQLRKFVS